jgi:hypothetical protein
MKLLFYAIIAIMMIMMPEEIKAQTTIKQQDGIFAKHERSKLYL